ncbi:MAG: hypothetical protein IJW60_05495 [Clostridia bacterium]|nr:hypothetical protein [Clostridia bacterium]
MRKISKLTIAALCSLGFALGGVATQNVSAADAERKFAVSELFLSENAKIQSGYAPEESNIAQTAVFFGIDARNTQVALTNVQAGEFSLLCEPILSSATSTLRAMSLTFTDIETEEYFDVYVSFGETANVRVIMDDVQAGISYQKNAAVSMTGIANSAGIYTQYDSMLLPITFAPDTMQVRVGEGANEKLVWDLSQKVNDNREVGETRKGFEKYSVHFTMHDFVGDSSGLAVYSLNGYSLGKIVVENEDAGEPRLTANITQKGIKGKTYRLPDVQAYDLVDGAIEEVQTRVFAPDGSSVVTDGKSFQPKTAGTYTVKYTAQNSFGNVGEKTYAIEIVETMPAYTYEFTETEHFPAVASAGENVYIPEMKIFGGLTIGYETVATVTIKRNNVSQVAAMNRESGFTYTFPKSGDYEIIYKLPQEELVFEVRVAEGETAVALNVELSKSYVRNTFIDLSPAKLSVDGVLTDFDLVVTDPAGNRFTNKQFICSEVGLYKLTAQSKTDAARKITYTFTVANKVQDLFGGNEDIISEYGKGMTTQANGVLAYTKAVGSVIKYQQTIDLTKYVNQVAPATGTEVNSKYAVNAFAQKYGDNKVGISETATPLIDFSVQPYAYDKMAMTGVNIVLTDVNEPSNKMTVKVINLMNSKTQAYIRAAAGTQASAGLHPGANNKDNTFYVENWGYIISHTFTGSFGTGTGFDMAKNRIQLFYDYEEKRLLVGEAGKNGMCLIVDFDDPRLCGGEIWDGFSTGEVELSIELSGMTYDKAGIAIYSVDGTDLSRETISYKTPNILVNAEYFEGLQGKTFPIPAVSAYDSGGATIANVKTQVVYAAENGKEYDINVKDGAFKTARAGKYYIRYFAMDKYGNEGMREIPVTVHETYADFTVSADIPDNYKSGKTGSQIALFPAENMTTANALAGETVAVEVKRGDENVAATENAFTPQKEGTYTVKYTFSDGVGRTATVTYQVEVAVETELVIYGALPTYRGFIEGNTYELYDVYVIDYAGGFSEPVKADVYIGGEKCEEGEYTPTVSAIEGENATEEIRYVTIEYKYGDKVIASYELPIRNVYKEKTVYIGATAFSSKSFEVGRYFYATGGVDITVADAVSMTATSDVAIADFLQPLASNGLNFVFDITGKNETYTPIDSNVESVWVYITDAQDKDKEILLTFITENGETKLYVNGAAATDAPSGALNGTSPDKFDITYNNVAHSLINTKDGKALTTVKTYANGEKFTGFGSQVYLRFIIERTDSTKSATVNVFGINGQNFSNVFEDDQVAPVIKVSGALEMSYPSGSTMTVPTATAYDVLSNVKEITVTVKLNGVPVQDVNGKTLENVPANVAYEVVLSSVGQYVIAYNAKDSRGATSVSTDFVVRSVVSQKPVITVSAELPTTVKVGTEVRLPTFTVTYLEGNEANLDYGVYITPSNQYQYLTESKFTPDKVGTYKIRYFALDAYGNYEIWEQTLEVTA